jgi:hypothetical protein
MGVGPMTKFVIDTRIRINSKFRLGLVSVSRDLSVYTMYRDAGRSWKMLRRLRARCRDCPRHIVCRRARVLAKIGV